MRLCHSSILIFTCFTCLGFYPHRASTATSNLASLEIAQASSTTPTIESILIPGSRGADVKRLQTKLKDLGYYNSEIDGLYGPNTQNAVLQFQKIRNLRRTDGVADLTTRNSLQTFWSEKNPVFASSISTVSETDVPETEPPQQSQRGFIWWSLLGLGILGSVGALLFGVKLLGQSKGDSISTTSEFTASGSDKKARRKPPVPEVENLSDPQENHVSVSSPQTAKPSVTTAVLPPEMTSRLTKLSIVDQLIQDLRSHDRSKRRKAIWNLGQQGDSRAIQPLVDLMINADSQQRSLILAALAEINARALRPMNRALAISLQDESPQVRQNAIRDLTRVYDMMSQMSQMLAHAVEDSDADVQTTAKYALTQMNQLRVLPNQQSLPEDHHTQPEQRKL
ncbi:MULTISPECIES: peptidoglycan-binding protein [Cyanophyceae]|uniref:peptidoglycan-binding protein n=1 Tax=Cyanophyceae TaxID=3028117 RepID=UPI00232EAAC4|nr:MULTISPECIES: peptidoglycan-binding protein [Cyanophyceae]MDB9358471.1 peptidoglycan-binding protein [Nodularia spumigena CS-587/03]MDB9317555.1 peptidoglycan-binding protein [Nodularia spumigena CS-590/01A]MDB9323348.1 peptidoglycan-binding protein [Nodularia spumigena CS-591/07A]MDB9328211.1 peptidoglycan-binding protein [Nodularia spumigena CS-590/02]MDB9332114.1 peptidoglycan-binding protein [Nodularia spumigena CS-591/04]